MIIEHAYAKLNLALEVVGKRSDGFHDLNMIVMPLALCDILTFELNQDIKLASDIDIEDNAILKTAKLIKNKYHVNQGVLITLEKHIPIGSGLGGESADISATIRGLNKLWNLQLKDEELKKLALELGSDTLFCLYNKTAYISGRGEHIEFLKKPPIEDVFLFISKHPISTRESFQNYTPKNKKTSFESLLFMYKSGDYHLFFEYTFNDLLETAYMLDKTLKNAYMTLKKQYKNAYMTGSGSTLFIIKKAEKIYKLEEIAGILDRNVIKTASID